MTEVAVGLSVSNRLIGGLLVVLLLASALLTVNEARVVLSAGFRGFDETAQAFTVLLATLGAIVSLLISTRFGSRFILVVSLLSLVILLFGGNFLLANREIFAGVSAALAAAAAVLVYTTRERGRPA